MTTSTAQQIAYERARETYERARETFMCPLCGTPGVERRKMRTHQKGPQCAVAASLRRVAKAGLVALPYVGFDETIWRLIGIGLHVEVELALVSRRKRKLVACVSQFTDPWVAQLCALVDDASHRVTLIQRALESGNPLEYLALAKTSYSIASGEIDLGTWRRERDGQTAVLDLIGQGPCRHPLHPMIDKHSKPCCRKELIAHTDVSRIYFEGNPELGRYVSEAQLARAAEVLGTAVKVEP